MADQLIMSDSLADTPTLITDTPTLTTDTPTLNTEKPTLITDTPTHTTDTPTLITETASKEWTGTNAEEEQGHMPGSEVNPRPTTVLKEEEATPPPPTSENGTTMAEESLSDSGPREGVDAEDSLSGEGGAGSDEQGAECMDSPSVFITSLEEDSRSLSLPALAEDACVSTDVHHVKDSETCQLHPGGAVRAAPPSAASAPPPAAGAAAAVPPVAGQVYYLVKWINWKEKKTPIITQSENGPCPLLAIMNTLFLRWKAKLPAQTDVVTTEDLMTHLGECVLAVTPREKADGMELNFQQNMSDVMAVLPKLSTGLDVNVGFSGVTDFEYTPECIVFDLLDIPLYHGWLVDPQSPEMTAAVGKLSYNQLVEKIIEYKHSTDSSRVSEGLLAEQFLESTATQLSYHGLCELNMAAKEGEISVFFRNNHFSTMIKHKGHLYLLVTDQGFLQEGALVWESLHNVEGDGNFCDSDFRLCHQRAPPTSTLPPCGQEQQKQIDQDYLVAVSLQQQGGATAPLSDLELARQLQQEEYHQQQQQQQGPVQTPTQVRGQGSQQSRRRDKDSDCVVL
ncbi:ubiquitin carboxyl-terminal hydrolase MINDY-1 [Solea senegalensis]|uniref:Ubiquitin carboxyl-terminal hydrolase n=1 Tax=Solea senegalensis TaxID=28829 RepID=A0AAV6PNE5_SOLSE|nr:ubiquitin carboxyl-terminal hydrolase MINDY-1-like isoform X1 [Solea senegalensis]XP_043870823.1 ubiquitin carboxyl-terminal hydrolase MINDY-1-like isoform X1 [Solea senegalensis]XP_043870824.1 ubiquitin carboxyl-terminal hydrolase MINDY-1-like isoform X1 [Solea senegalensis]XP_043870825.1 ubiquitin carboxyl-terminal hydrolase MINDY-1-like isoform X1 [Solea senegalensis]XP_043870826.1 ubiquitin carboxyl-terminal hydrolase MINDY-1-like isoform X1 [Solea senegalensis]XP_043872970.1 ubiquitin 